MVASKIDIKLEGKFKKHDNTTDIAFKSSVGYSILFDKGDSDDAGHINPFSIT